MGNILRVSASQNTNAKRPAQLGKPGPLAARGAGEGAAGEGADGGSGAGADSNACASIASVPASPSRNCCFVCSNAFNSADIVDMFDLVCIKMPYEEHLRNCQVAAETGFFQRYVWLKIMGLAAQRIFHFRCRRHKEGMKNISISEMVSDHSCLTVPCLSEEPVNYSLRPSNYK